MFIFSGVPQKFHKIRVEFSRASQNNLEPFWSIDSIIKTSDSKIEKSNWDESIQNIYSNISLKNIPLKKIFLIKLKILVHLCIIY